MTPDSFSSSSNPQRTTATPSSVAPSASSQRTSWVVPKPTTACRTVSTESFAAGSSEPPQPASVAATSSSAALRFGLVRTLLALAIATLTLAIVPSALATPAAATRTSQSVADFWSGTWPAFLMENGVVTDPLGTLRWRQIRREEGAAQVGHVFGGKILEGCSTTDPSTLFFRGSYVEGGDLIACTTSADGKTIVGRFNGREDFMSGSFEVSIVRDDDKRVFAGKYFEDQGITTDWCGSLESRSPVTSPPNPPEDLEAPTSTALASAGKAGTAVKLRFRVSEPAVVTLTVRRGTRVVGRMTRSVAGGLAAAAWRAPRKPGLLSFTVVAVDAAGNTGRASRATLRLR